METISMDTMKATGTMKAMDINKRKMKTNKIAYSVTALFTVALFLSSCQTPEQKLAAANENMAEAKTILVQAQEDSTNAYNDSVADYQASEKQWQAEIDSNEKDLVAYRAEVASENNEDRINHEKRVNDLEKTNNGLKASIRDFKEDGKESWRKFKTGVNKDVKDFGKDMAAFGESIKHLGDKKNSN
jgi:hypothetical protein